jgi:hypothetical protein
MLPVSHDHAEAWLEPGHIHAWDSVIAQVDMTQTAFPRSAGNLSDDELETCHSHFLIGNGSVITKSQRGDPLDSISFSFFAVPLSLQVPLLCNTSNVFLREFPGSHPKDALPLFTGSSPPKV